MTSNDANAIANETPIAPAQVPSGYVRVRFRDPDLPHQIAQNVTSAGHITVSCNCMRIPHKTGSDGYKPIAVRPKWEADEAQAVWREHLLEDQ